MFKISFISDAEGPVTTKLCESTRTLAEHGFTLNNERVLQIENLVRANYSLGIDRLNKRNVISFQVSRAEDFTGDAFESPEEAFVFAIDHVNGAGGGSGASDMGGSGTLKMEFSAPSYSATRYMHNALVQAIAANDTNTGVCLGFNYTFTGGLIDTNA